MPRRCPCNSTTIGLYDTRAFGFEPKLTLPVRLSDVSEFWVSPEEHALYVVVAGDLLRIPFSQELVPQ